MKITLRGKNIEITEAIEEKVSEKLSKLDKYFIVSENVEAKALKELILTDKKLK